RNPNAWELWGSLSSVGAHPYRESASMTTTDTIATARPRDRRPRRSIGRVIGLSAFGLVAGLIVLALIAASFVTWTVQRSFPTLDGTVSVEGLNSDVTVDRDVKGVPTIVADTTDDLFFAQGYVHAQDRFWEMDFRRHVTSGRLAELFGESQIGTDSFIRTLGWRGTAEAELSLLEPEVLGYYEAYADGVNAYLADHSGADVSLEYAVLGLQTDYEIEPWEPADSVAWLKAMAWDLRSNVETETERALRAQNHTAEEIAALYPTYPFDANPIIVPSVAKVARASAPSTHDGQAQTV